MDHAFFQKAQRLLNAGHAPAPLDHALLLASVTARQAITATARRAASGRRRAGVRGPAEPLVSVVLGEAEWQDAACAQAGCFARFETKQTRNAS